MTDDLLAALRALHPRPSPEEVADALWLAERMRGGDAPEPSPPPPAAPPEPVPETGPPTPAVAGWPDGAAEPAGGTAPGPSPGMSVFLAGETPDSASPLLVRAPAPPAIPRALRLARALRPLRARVPSRTRHELDEEGTARQFAETGVWRPRLVPERERWFDLALVVDTGRSMAVWRRTAEEFAAVLERVGAFRDVRLWRLDTDRPGPPRPVPGTGSGRSPDELVDPTRRRLILVFSDGIGAAWADGRAGLLLERWAAAGPVAVVQPLPERLWPRCAARIEHVTLTAPAPAVPNARLGVRTRDGGPVPPGLPIPVLELEPHWLAGWATLVTRGCRDAPGAALFTRDPRGEPRGAADPAKATPEPGAVERVLRFRATASPRAFHLACYLAAAPLRLPVMRLVQRAMLPDSTPADLAEIYLSDLLRVVGGAADPDELTYGFREGVRSVLIGALRRGEALRVLREVWRVIRTHHGSSLDFPALLTAIQQDGAHLPPDQAFAEVTAEVLGRLGGRYGDIAKLITARAEEMFGPSGPDGPAPAALGAPAAPVRGPLPRRNPHFTGREALLGTLRQRLETGEVAVLLPPPGGSPGGEGKSQLAVEYAHKFGDEYDIVWFIPADQMPLARSALADLARELGVPESDSFEGIVESLLDTLRADTGRRWLLVFDNARDPEELLPVLPLASRTGDGPLRTSQPTGHVLVTSQNREWARLADPLSVDVFERQESVSYLCSRVPDLTAEEADQVARRLGDLPLAVEQAAGWLSTTGEGAAAYLRLFDPRLAALELAEPPEHIPSYLAAAFGLNLDRLSDKHPRVKGLFDLWAYFGPEPVSAVLLSYGRDLPPPLGDVLGDDAELRAALRLIDRFRLAHYDPGHGALQIHRLVRAMLRRRLSEAERADVRGRVHTILAAAVPPHQPDDETTWARRALVTPHVLPSHIIDSPVRDHRAVALDQAQYLNLSGDFAGARTLAERALARWGGTPDDEVALGTSRALANALRGLGDIRTAARLSATTLERARRALGQDHPTTLFTALGYGADLKNMGAFAEAVAHDLDTWRKMERRYGRDSAQYTHVAAGNLALGYRLLGEFHKAYEIDRSALGSLRDNRAPRYRDIFNFTHHVARDLHGLGRYEEALAMQRQSLESRDPVLSPDHALVLQARMSHAGTLRELGRHTEAERMAAEAFQAHVRRFGDGHPNTLAAKSSLALARMALGQVEEAHRTQREVWHDLRRIMGERHPFVHARAGGVAAALRAMGDPAAAYGFDRAAVEGLADAGGGRLYYRLCVLVGMAHDLYLLGEPEPALRFGGEAHRGMVKLLGDAHPHTVACARNLRLIESAVHVAKDPPEHDRFLECLVEPVAL
ncbi:FxSxx-COOH system tetratricopeptide repeat protein [Actinocorallia sp. API 0066]|uniref:FxSxx-COOH system tetratricopeptide repeat protein n=1 Tax=Actinocorallia sp. API 0066 TaxID=2896846 RepID=UPI001E615BC2|nr:FxSxx-COOH system tetratricopeptide repeat protein [Actinocorallia sp. API 0066]MCD0452393.1 FxSxx-COOH system tetratricopeptide repeat protein [Actinocorallia sp. API 0066]